MQAANVRAVRGSEGGMTEREIWFQWVVHRQSTREISRKFDLEECDVDRTIARCMNAQHDGTAMPFEKRTA